MGCPLKLVLIINPDSLWTTGIERLLENIASLKVVSAQVACNRELIQEIYRLHPDVVIWDESLGFAGLGDITMLLNQSPKLGIFVVSIYDNLVHIYYKREILVTKATDLVTEIQRI